MKWYERIIGFVSASGTTDINKFQVGQIFNDSKGKTQVGLICGCMLCVTACILPFKYPEQTATAVTFATLGAGLLGLHQIAKDKELSGTTTETETITENK